MPRRRGKKFSTETNLGKVLHNKGWRVRDLAYKSDVNERMLSDYLAGRIAIPEGHRLRFSKALGVPPEVF
jgi:lambda repressor-like predicted transcriptional regulator